MDGKYKAVEGERLQKGKDVKLLITAEMIEGTELEEVGCISRKREQNERRTR